MRKFPGTVARIQAAGIDFDAIDWHIYATSPGQVFRTVEIVRRIYSDKPLIISELNLDWRYTGNGGKESQERNSGWDSAVWLATAFDGLQRLGVSTVQDFCGKGNFFGLVDYAGNELRPANFVFRTFTRELGRQRADAPVAIKPADWPDETGKVAMLDRAWYQAHRMIGAGGRAAELVWRAQSGPELTLPPRGLMLLDRSANR